jgi:hypothetical protein
MTNDQTQMQQESVQEWVGKIRAVAIDTNAVGRGTFDLEQLKLLAHQSKKHNKMELWIAEPVMWEWAEHLRLDRAKLNEARSNLIAAGMKLEAQSADINDALTFVRDGIRSLGDHVKILTIESVAVEAIMDQILVRSPGERVNRDGQAVTKGGGKAVKTGAADSAIYRTYLRQAGGQTDTYVVLSGDSDIHKAHKAWGVDNVRVVHGTKALDKDLFRVMPASASLVAACASYLLVHLESVDLASFEAPSTLVDWELDGSTSSFAAIGAKVLAGLSDAKWDKEARLVTAEAWVLTDLVGPQVSYDINGDKHTDAATLRPYEDANVHVGLTFALGDDGPTSLTMGEVNFVNVNVGSEDVYEDDGPLIILENLGVVPGLEDFEWAESFYEPVETSYVVDGDTLQLTFSGSAAHEWTLTASYRGEEVDITATPRYDGMDWGDGNVIGGTAWLAADSEFALNHPSLAVNALVMNTAKPARTEPFKGTERRTV